MFKNSSVSDFDNTFEAGSLTTSNVEKITVSVIEVWAFPDRDSIDNFMQFKKNEQARKKSNAKNTKKALFDNSFNQV